MSHLALTTSIVDHEPAIKNNFAGLPVIFICDDDINCEFLPSSVRASLTIAQADDGSIRLAIANSVDMPVLMHVKTLRTLVITIADNIDADLVLVAQKSAQIKLNGKTASRCNLYLAPAVDQELNLEAMLTERAQFNLFEMGAMVHACKRTMHIRLLGEKAHFNYVGLDLLQENEHKESELVIKHEARETLSTQKFRGIYGGASNGSFLGRVVIEENARDSSAQQLYKTIIVGDRARAKVLPELVIHNHDISASHGATIGELDSEVLFYLRSRGLSMSDAQALLIESIAKEMLALIDNRHVRTALTNETERAIAHLIANNAS